MAIVMDLFSRKIGGWATRSSIHRELVLDAVLMHGRYRAAFNFAGIVALCDYIARFCEQDCEYQSETVPSSDMTNSGLLRFCGP